MEFHVGEFAVGFIVRNPACDRSFGRKARASGPAQQRRVHVEKGVMTFRTSPGKEQVAHRECTRTERNARRIAVLEVADPEVTAGKSHLTLIEPEH